MKCIKNNDRIERVSDGEAEKRVKAGTWAYCDKTSWKKAKRGAKEAEAPKAPKKADGSNPAPTPVSDKGGKGHPRPSKKAPVAEVK